MTTSDSPTDDTASIDNVSADNTAANDSIPIATELPQQPTVNTASHDWLTPPVPPVPAAAQSGSKWDPRRWRTAASAKWAAGAGALVAAGLIGAAIAVGVGGHNDGHRDSSLPAAMAAYGQANGQQGQGFGVGQDGTQGGAFGPPGQSGQGQSGQPGQSQSGSQSGQGIGQVSGEQHIQGTLTALTSSTITVKSSTGTATYTITSTTQIVRNGATATVSQLQVGDPVLVHVYPSSDGSPMQVERIFAGTLPTGGSGALPPTGGNGTQPPTADVPGQSTGS